MEIEALQMRQLVNRRTLSCRNLEANLRRTGRDHFLVLAMSSNRSDSRWLELLKQGDSDAARVLWERYFRLLIDGARQRLGVSPKRAADEEDVALSAFASFCRAVEIGRFPRLDNRNDLRTILLMLVTRKAHHAIRRESSAKRGGGEITAFGDLRDDNGDLPLDPIDPEPHPAIAVQMAEECDRLLSKLSAELREIALATTEGYTVTEIAERLGRSDRTIARKLAEIRDIWNDERSSE